MEVFSGVYDAMIELYYETLLISSETLPLKWPSLDLEGENQTLILNREKMILITNFEELAL